MSRDHPLSLNLSLLPREYGSQIKAAKERLRNNELKIQEERKKQELLQSLLSQITSQSSSSKSSQVLQRNQSGRSYGTDVSSCGLANQFNRIKEFMNHREQVYQENCSLSSNSSQKRQSQPRIKTRSRRVYQQQDKINNLITVKPWPKDLFKPNKYDQWEKREHERIDDAKDQEYFQQRLGEIKRQMRLNFHERSDRQARYRRQQQQNAERLEKQRNQIRHQLIQQQKLKLQTDEPRSSEQAHNKGIEQRIQRIRQVWSHDNEVMAENHGSCSRIFKKDKDKLKRMLSRAQKGIQYCIKAKSALNNTRAEAYNRY